MFLEPYPAYDREIHFKTGTSGHYGNLKIEN